MVAMIIKGLFRRYERWNPVHPTYGAFWGMGVGIGCGVGWGPGFGPEVIGYVGAGCGVGFSVGITLAGVGIGLPANFVTDVPYKGYEWSNNISSQFLTLQQKANESFSYLKDLDLMKKGTDVFDVKSALCSQGKLISENFRILKKNLSISSKENKD
ncbi:cadmium-induced protein AS8 [Amaranthus tricolor]|uniref:cadmium-induced protein AS8 n=1 Tax=Amaranthus tricolor TaxID=29722 RepID=UPI0025878D41|nr:cadmium-induced protein AS8 [Amaranthus tricolor]